MIWVHPGSAAPALNFLELISSVLQAHRASPSGATGARRASLPSGKILTNFCSRFLILNRFNPILFLNFTLDLCTQIIYTRI